MKQHTARSFLALIGLLFVSAVLMATTSFTITYDGNGNTGGSVPVDKNKYSAGQSVTVLGNTGKLERTDYRFDGWNTKADSSGINVAVGSTYTMQESNVLLYAKWVKTTTLAMHPVIKPVGLKPAVVNIPGRKTLPSSYTVTFDSQGASTPANPATKIVTSPATTVGNLPTAPIKTDSIFGGWYTGRNGGGSAFAATTAVTANTTVYAKWNVASSVDLVIEDIVLTPANPKNSDTVYINTKIKNQGTAFAYFPATDPGWVFAYYVNGRLYSGQGASPNLAIAPGAIDDRSGYFLSPFQYAPGTYTIRAVADPNGKISESDETNNEKSITFTLVDAGKPDLVISNILVTPAQGTVNTTFRVEVTIKNQGVAKFTSPVNANMPLLTGDQLPGQYAAPPNQVVLEPNQTTTYIFSLGPLPPGTRTWTYTVDSGNLISESDETNNQRSFTTSVEAATQTGQPDLVIEDIVLTPANPKNSDTVYINTKIKNQGTAFAYFPATDPGWVFAYYMNGRLYSGQGASPNLAIAPGAVDDRSGYFLSPFQYAPGTYTIRAVADPNGKISESDETNNEKSITFTLVDAGKPDLVISDILVTPAQGMVNTTFRIEVTIKNQGMAKFTSPVNANMPLLTGDQLPGQYAAPPNQVVLEPNQTTTYIFSLGPLPPGTRTWTYTVDSGNLISESDETNNQRSFTTIVK